MNGQSVGSRLRQEVRRLGYGRLTDFASATCIPYSTVQGYASDKRRPGGEHLSSMLEVGVDVAWVLTGKTFGSVSRCAAIEALAGDDRALAEAIQWLCRGRGATA